MIGASIRWSQILLAVILAAQAGAALRAQAKPPTPPQTTVSGTLKGAASMHDGKSDWSAILVGRQASYLVVLAGADYKLLKKFAGKRVLVQGEAITEFRDRQSGETMKLSGAIAGIRYDGNLSIKSIDAVTEQKAVERKGVVQAAEAGPDADSRATDKGARLLVDGKSLTAAAGSPAAKKLLAHLGKEVVVRCYLNGDTIDDIDTVTVVKLPGGKADGPPHSSLPR